MKAASLSDIKKELKLRDTNSLQELCLRLIKYKKENKELITYLLFENQDESGYKKLVKAEIVEMFGEINRTNLYWVKKTLRKILRYVNKWIKYSGLKQTEVELRIHFCETLLESGINYRRSKALQNIYDREVERIVKAQNTLHEDVQFDYQEQIDSLSR